MSLRVKKTMGTRSNLREREYNKKYIFVFEGEKTEKKYFEELANYKQELGITDLIYIEILERQDETKSNQLSVVKSLDEYLSNVVLMKESYDNIKYKINTMVNSKLELSDEVKIRILNLANECFNDNSYYENIDKFIDGLKIILIEEPDLEYFIEDIKDIKESLNLDYDKVTDEVCIIIDRDKGSFKKHQYDEVIKICMENDYNLGITNPCFEFWLLLHLSDCKEYELEDIRINRKTSKSRNSKRFVEKELANKLGGSYNKSNLQFLDFKDKIHIAIKNQELYEQDVLKLEDNVGSRVGIIIDKMIKEK